jgi:hypothetical protein
MDENEETSIIFKKIKRKKEFFIEIVENIHGFISKDLNNRAML